MSDETTRPSLSQALLDHHKAVQAADEEARRPEREAIEAQLAADAKLYGTAGWDGLSDRRKQQVSMWAAQQAQAGGDAA